MDYLKSLNAYLPSNDFIKAKYLLVKEFVGKHILPADAKIDVVSVTKCVGVTLVVFSVVYCGKIWYDHRFFKKRGIKTPPYKFISGNYHDIVKNNYSNQLRQWTTEYGNTFGFYEGHLPILVTSDADFIQEVFIKQFGNFVARKKVPFQVSDKDPVVNLVFAAKGRWKRMRNIMNPTFSPAKLKELMPLLRMCSTRLLDEMANYVDKDINVSQYLSRFTMDTICNCAFGLDFDVLKNPNNIFFQKAINLFEGASQYRYGLLFFLYFHEFKGIFNSLSNTISFIEDFMPESLAKFSLPFFWFRRHIGKVVDMRKNANIVRRDYLQILLEVQSDDFKEDTNKDNSRFAQTKYARAMTWDEVKLNLLLFMIAGYDTTSNSLSYCFFVLAKHPDEMVKLQEEIDANFDDAKEPDYDNIMELSYLDMFVKEVLRMYPIGNNAVNRRCTVPCTINGISIPTDLVIAVDVLSVHYNPDYWGPEDPEKFYPERFSPDAKRHPSVFLPFGNGPRTCIGMRFALLEVKLALVNLLRRYDVVATKNTPAKLEFKEGPALRRPKTGINVMFKKRMN